MAGDAGNLHPLEALHHQPQNERERAYEGDLQLPRNGVLRVGVETRKLADRKEKGERKAKQGHCA